MVSYILRTTFFCITRIPAYKNHFLHGQNISEHCSAGDIPHKHERYHCRTFCSADTLFFPSSEYTFKQPQNPLFFSDSSFPLTPSQASEPDSRPLTVTHLHYTAWPDHGVPQNAMSLISFICRVRKLHPPSLDQPLLVHCSAGVGRTGTFILLDAMMQQMRSEGSLSVHQFLGGLRGQRMKLVQTQVCRAALPHGAGIRDQSPPRPSTSSSTTP